MCVLFESQCVLCVANIANSYGLWHSYTRTTTFSQLKLNRAYACFAESNNTIKCRIFWVSLSEHQQINFRLGIKLMRRIKPTASASSTRIIVKSICYDNCHRPLLVLLYLPWQLCNQLCNTTDSNGNGDGSGSKKRIFCSSSSSPSSSSSS